VIPALELQEEVAAFIEEVEQKCVNAQRGDPLRDFPEQAREWGQAHVPYVSGLRDPYIALKTVLMQTTRLASNV